MEVGDCRDRMKELEAESIDSIVTDPPYGLSFMGKEWDHGVPGVEFWTEAMRVAKPGAHLLAFGGTRTFHRLAVAIEDAGWEIRDCVMWVYGSGFPKSHNLKDEWNGWGTALKPAWEPIIVARKPFVGTVAENVVRYGTGALNIEGCRIGNEQTTTIRNGNSGKNGIYQKDNRTFARINPPGRWPANLIHDGSEEVSDPLGSAARFFYCAKASKADRDDGCEGNHHPTVKPTDLMAYLCRLVTPPGGTVLDPFTGSGSTGRGAMCEGLNFIGFELSPEYAEIARARIAACVKSEALF